MPVTIDSSAKQTVGMTSTANAVCAFTGAAGAFLLAGTVTRTNLSVSACNVNGVAMTQIGRVRNDGAGHVATLFCLTTPPVGVLSISATLVGGVTDGFMIGGITYLGVRGVNPVGDIQTQTVGAVTTAVMSISTSTTDVAVLFAIGHSNFSITATCATTRIQDGQDVVYRWGDVAGPGAAVSLSVSAVNTNQNMAMFGFNVVASLSGASVYMNMLGVGF